MNEANDLMPITGSPDLEGSEDLILDYIVDAFTKSEDSVDLEVDTANISCLNSKNGNFSLDAEGNLTVNSLSYNNADKMTLNVLDAYPIGSIYLSVNNTNPSSFFGGEWSLWGEGRCIVGVDPTQSEFAVAEHQAGEKEHVLTTNELPAHTHEVSGGNHKHTYTGYLQVSTSSSTAYVAIAHKKYAADGVNTPPSMNSSGSHTHTVSSVGSSNAHNNLQPYITCYMWKRIS